MANEGSSIDLAATHRFNTERSEKYEYYINGIVFGILALLFRESDYANFALNSLNPLSWSLILFATALTSGILSLSLLLKVNRYQFKVYEYHEIAVKCSEAIHDKLKEPITDHTTGTEVTVEQIKKREIEARTKLDIAEKAGNEWARYSKVFFWTRNLLAFLGLVMWVIAHLHPEKAQEATQAVCSGIVV